MDRPETLAILGMQDTGGRQLSSAQDRKGKMYNTNSTKKKAPHKKKKMTVNPGGGEGKAVPVSYKTPTELGEIWRCIPNTHLHDTYCQLFVR